MKEKIWNILKSRFMMGIYAITQIGCLIIGIIKFNEIGIRSVISIAISIIMIKLFGTMYFRYDETIEMIRNEIKRVDGDFE